MMSKAEEEARFAFCEAGDKTLTANRYLAWKEAKDFLSDKDKQARELLFESEAERIVERSRYEIEHAEERERLMRAITFEAIQRMSTVAGRMRMLNRDEANEEIKALADNLAEPLTLMRELEAASRARNV